MKTIKPLIFILSFFLSIGAIHPRVIHAQDTNSKEGGKVSNIKNMIMAKDFAFIAQSVSPMGGATRQLTSIYDLKVSKDSIVSFLPYFGRAYTAPMNPSEGGINFTSTKFQYTTTERRRGGWNILVKLEDAADTRQLSLTVSESGSASLQVTSNNRQPVSFNGYITERKGNK